MSCRWIDRVGLSCGGSLLKFSEEQLKPCIIHTGALFYVINKIVPGRAHVDPKLCAITLNSRFT